MAKRVFGTSFPRSGTHLLTKVFSGLGYRTQAFPKHGTSVQVDGLNSLDLEAINQPFYGYGHWRAEDGAIEALLGKDFKVLVLVRDPRDLCLSLADFFLSGQPKVLLDREPWIKDLKRNDLVARIITGKGLPTYEGWSIERRCQNWMEWSEHGGLILRYEELESSVASGTPIEKIAELGIAPETFLSELNKAFGDRSTKTFNKGIARRWVTEFDDELTEVWRQNASGVASLFGYEEC